MIEVDFKVIEFHYLFNQLNQWAH